VKYEIALTVEASAEDVDTRALERLALRALEAEDVAAPSELSIVLADDATVQALNRTYRATDAPTDVLSFSQSEGAAFVRPDEALPHLGDVVISLETARRQAGEHGQTMQAETQHLLVHGILHLLGYDHEQPDDAQVMHGREERLLGATRHH